MKHVFGFLFLCSFQLYSQTYLNILLSDDSYKSSQISELNKITFSSSGDVMYFHLSDLTIASENTANVKKFIFGNTPLGEPLPVELSFFSATQLGISVILKWRTEIEISNYGFDIERAGDAKGFLQNWGKIGFVPGNGNSNSPKDYSFTDNPPAGSKYHYRLKQIDTDGQFEYSDVITVDFGIPSQYALHQNYPNPFNPETNITYNIPVDGNISVKLYDLLGNQVAVLINDYQKAGVYTIPFYADKLASGIYICKMSSGNFNSTVKMMLVK